MGSKAVIAQFWVALGLSDTLAMAPEWQLFHNPIREGLATTRNLTVHECAVPQQFSPTTGQFRAFRVFDLSINLDGKEA